MAGLVGLGVPPGAEGSFPGRNGLIAILDEYPCGLRISTVAPDGSGLRPVTGVSSCEYPVPVFEFTFHPEWSPDGRRLLFWQSVQPLGSDSADVGFRLINADGSGLSDVPGIGAGDGLGGRPSFAPDGTRFAIVQQQQLPSDPRQGAPPETIWIARIDGTLDGPLHEGSNPRWSPNGRRIAYTAPPPGPWTGMGRTTWLLNAQSGQPIRRVAPLGVRSLDWSPDSRRLVYTTASGVFVTRANGRRTRRLITTSGAFGVSWSPNGRRIAVVDTRVVDPGLQWRYVITTMSPTATQRKRVYTGGEFDSDETVLPPEISWQPRPRR
jgi:Tol biopolymer transport system component